MKTNSRNRQPTARLRALSRSLNRLRHGLKEEKENRDDCGPSIFFIDFTSEIDIEDTKRRGAVMSASTPFSLLLLLLLLLLTFNIPLARTAIPSTQANALCSIAFDIPTLASLSVSPWDCSNGVPLSDPCGGFHGVSCDATNSTITSLYLSLPPLWIVILSAA